MKRHEVRLREPAYDDLDDLDDWLVSQGVGRRTIETYLGRVWDRIQRIGDAPHASRARDDLEPGLRTVAFEGRLVIAFVIAGDVVEITNLFSRGRDYEALYPGRPESEDGG